MRVAAMVAMVAMVAVVASAAVAVGAMGGAADAGHVFLSGTRAAAPTPNTPRRRHLRPLRGADQLDLTRDRYVTACLSRRSAELTATGVASVASCWWGSRP